MRTIVSMPKPATILAESSINDSVISALVVALRTDLPECRADFASFVGIDTVARRDVGGERSVDDGLPQDDVPAIGQQFVGGSLCREIVLILFPLHWLSTGGPIGFKWVSSWIDGFKMGSASFYVVDGCQMGSARFPSTFLPLIKAES